MCMFVCVCVDVCNCLLFSMFMFVGKHVGVVRAVCVGIVSV